MHVCVHACLPTCKQASRAGAKQFRASRQVGMFAIAWSWEVLTCFRHESQCEMISLRFVPGRAPRGWGGAAPHLAITTVLVVVSSMPEARSPPSTTSSSATRSP
eukprot:3912591-Alexandrium_andersonii.AAC.1